MGIRNVPVVVGVLSLALAFACGTRRSPVRPIPDRKPLPGPFDAAAPMVASGTIIAEGNASLGNVQPAKSEMKNVPAMGDVPMERFLAAMLALKGAIGADCEECHPKDRYESDEMRSKLRTRQMIRMSLQINTDFFERQARVTCYTCHRGKWAPEQEELESHIRPTSLPVRALGAEEAAAPAEALFKNVQGFRGKPSSHLMGRMFYWTAELGADCTYCHAEDGDWEKETSQKDVTRAMMAMMDRINEMWFSGEPIVTCWGCHRGAPIPARTAPEPEPGRAPETRLP